MASNLIPTARLLTLKDEFETARIGLTTLNTRNAELFRSACAAGGAWAMLADAIASVDQTLADLGRKSLKAEEKAAMGIDNLANEVSQIRKALAFGTFAQFHEWLCDKAENGVEYSSMQNSAKAYAAEKEFEAKKAEYDAQAALAAEFNTTPLAEPPAPPSASNGSSGRNKGPFDPVKKWETVKKSMTADEMKGYLAAMLRDEDVVAVIREFTDGTAVMNIASGNVNESEGEQIAA